MALIKCPECNKEISDKSLQCIYCGYPINEFMKQKNNQLYDCVDIKLTNCPKNNEKQIMNIIGCDILNDIRQEDAIKCMQIVINIVQNLSTIKSNITLEEANEIKQKIEEAGGEVEIYPATETARKEVANRPKNVNELRCPRCGSTAITTGQRGFSLITGFIGSKQTVNRCGNCGKTWYPTRWD